MTFKTKKGIMFSIVVCAFIIYAYAVYKFWYCFKTHATQLNLGTMGDFLGGTSAPFINLISAVLVYFAFNAQTEANEKIQQQIDEEKMHRNFELIKEEIKNVNEYYNIKFKASGYSSFIQFLYPHFNQAIIKPYNATNPSDEFQTLSHVEIRFKKIKSDLMRLIYSFDLIDRLLVSKEHKDVLFLKYNDLIPISEIDAILEISEKLSVEYKRYHNKFNRDTGFISVELQKKIIDSCLEKLTQLKGKLFY